MPKKPQDADYWREIVAAAASIERVSLADPRAPKGLAEALGTQHFYYVKCGSLELHHNGEWEYKQREKTTVWVLKYAHRTREEALAALRAAVAPAEPACSAAPWEPKL